jgi:hypothetical protein
MPQLMPTNKPANLVINEIEPFAYPIIAAVYSDQDVIHIGDAYYLTPSTFGDRCKLNA